MQGGNPTAVGITIGSLALIVAYLPLIAVIGHPFRLFIFVLPATIVSGLGLRRETMTVQIIDA
jgi:hypothetical protein